MYREISESDSFDVHNIRNMMATIVFEDMMGNELNKLVFIIFFGSLYLLYFLVVILFHNFLISYNCTNPNIFEN
jgi:hypothetical protein